ncbi:hypothetical protein [Niabella aquatica]
MEHPIHQYTSIHSLAHILKSRKIRFTRLDCLDDKVENEGIPPPIAKTFYVSCWVENKEESIEMWSLYAKFTGVRISLAKDMFQKHFIPYADNGGWYYGQDGYRPLPLDQIRTDDFIITNPFAQESDFYVKVNYSENPKALRGNLFSHSDRGYEIKNFREIAAHKHTRWQFQNEHRFYLMIMPLIPLHLCNGDRSKQMQQIAIYDNHSNAFSHFDLPLSNDAIDNIVVTVSPNAPEADYIIVESLLEKYTKNGKIRESELRDIIAPK